MKKCFLLCFFGILSWCAYELNAMAGARLYSINLGWINSKLDKSARLIFPEEYSATIYTWAEKNPASIVNFWYDGAFVTSEAIARTEKMLNEGASHKVMAPIRLRNIRDLEEVRDNPAIFSAEIPLYFRIDLTRPTILYHSIISERCEYAIHQDLDMPPLTEKEIFDEDTLLELSIHGIVMAADESEYFYENSFMMLSHEKPNLLKALKDVVIDLNIARAYKAREGGFKKDASRHFDDWGMRMSCLPELVYKSYPSMMVYFWNLEDCVRFTRKDSSFAEKNEFSPGEIFGLDRYDHFPSRFEPLVKEPEGLGFSHMHVKHLLMMPPTKKVTLVQKEGLGYHVDEFFNDRAVGAAAILQPSLK